MPLPLKWTKLLLLISGGTVQLAAGPVGCCCWRSPARARGLHGFNELEALLWEEHCEAGNAAAAHNSELIFVSPPCFSDVCLVVQCSKAIPASVPVAWFPDCCMPPEIIFFDNLGFLLPFSRGLYWVVMTHWALPWLGAWAVRFPRNSGRCGTGCARSRRNCWFLSGLFLNSLILLFLFNSLLLRGGFSTPCSFFHVCLTFFPLSN